MKAQTNLILMYMITVGLFIYAFAQPIFLPNDITNTLHFNPFALGFGIAALIMDIKQYRRIKSHYKHLVSNIFNPNCKDCITEQQEGKTE